MRCGWNINYLLEHNQYPTVAICASADGLLIADWAVNAAGGRDDEVFPNLFPIPYLRFIPVVHCAV